MKPEEVTSEMERVYFGDVYSKRDRTLKEEIAAAFNAVTNDAEPITAERLVKMGYMESESARGYFYHPADHMLVVMGRNLDVHYNGATLATKTIGQLRALHAGLGIGEVK